jgi:hypothetical protein
VPRAPVVAPALAVFCCAAPGTGSINCSSQFCHSVSASIRALDWFGPHPFPFSCRGGAHRRAVCPNCPFRGCQALVWGKSVIDCAIQATCTHSLISCNQFYNSCRILNLLYKRQCNGYQSTHRRIGMYQQGHRTKISSE